MVVVARAAGSTRASIQAAESLAAQAPDGFLPSLLPRLLRELLKGELAGPGGETARPINHLTVVDLDQFVEPVGAGMTLQNCLAPMRRQSAGELRIGEQTLQLPLHLRTVAGDQIILARGE